MSDKSYYLIHANLAHAKAALEDPMMSDFVAQIDEIDALAASWPGFIAQPSLPDEGEVFGGHALLNVSIWSSVAHLHEFTYDSHHTDMLDRRAEWFHQSDRPAYVLFWVPAEEIPTEAEIQTRFEHLARKGPTPYSFNFDQPFTVEEMLAYKSR